jgi:hypothetical protein
LWWHGHGPDSLPVKARPLSSQLAAGPLRAEYSALLGSAEKSVSLGNRGVCIKLSAGDLIIPGSWVRVPPVAPRVHPHRARQNPCRPCH